MYVVMSGVVLAHVAAYVLMLTIGAYFVHWARILTGGRWQHFLIGAAGFALAALLLKPVINAGISLYTSDASVWIRAVSYALAAASAETGVKALLLLFVMRNLQHYQFKAMALCAAVGYALAEVVVVGFVASAGDLYLRLNPQVLSAVMQSIESVQDQQVLSARISLLSELTAWLMLLERLGVVVLQAGLFALVYLSISKGQLHYFGAAVAAHFLIDVPAAMYQLGQIDLMAVEMWLLVLVMISVSFIYRFWSELDA
ncbi:hypothetical protein DMO17_18705 [Aquipseudomonas alcaligenes]|uniref:YhfC family intramembrane metalloprotease n=1 Tax=Aquipseudomonas alcaligenes TaxID=43263 RepID=A0A2V4KJR2_AQUAC|nr:YhfC family glutamic-type intramembrane protease [Pseudomonas alcaligenes]PYC20229.1 hypothetical protein DMO17_18705 [Pseudomonas alcaligenes]